MTSRGERSTGQEYIMMEAKQAGKAEKLTNQDMILTPAKSMKWGK